MIPLTCNILFTIVDIIFESMEGRWDGRAKNQLGAWTAVCRQDRAHNGCTSNPISTYSFLNIAFFCRLCYEITGNSIMIRERAGRVLCIIILLEKTFLLVCSSSMNKMDILHRKPPMIGRSTYYRTCMQSLCITKVVTFSHKL